MSECIGSSILHTPQGYFLAKNISSFYMIKLEAFIIKNGGHAPRFDLFNSASY